tara:strand:- start:1852 stop:2151 length:300 start_codon:yes stop_codon:yes gene_type:complete
MYAKYVLTALFVTSCAEQPSEQALCTPKDSDLSVSKSSEASPPQSILGPTGLKDLREKSAELDEVSDALFATPPSEASSEHDAGMPLNYPTDGSHHAEP